MRLSIGLPAIFLPAILVPTAPALTVAQAPAYFTSLSLPPASVGTCLPVKPSGAVRAGFRGHHIVMTSVQPDAHRDMMVFTDSAGGLLGYNELTTRAVSLGVSDGESVFARLARDGRMVGVIGHTTVAMRAPAPGQFDTASMNAMRRNAKTTATRDSLTVADAKRVRAAAAWLIKRCPN